MQDIEVITPTTVSPHDYRTSADFGMVNKLLKNPRYEIPERLRHKVITSIERIVDSPETDSKMTLDAIKTLSMLDKINVELVKSVLPKRVEQTPVRQLTDEMLLEEVKKIMKALPLDLPGGLPSGTN